MLIFIFIISGLISVVLAVHVRIITVTVMEIYTRMPFIRTCDNSDECLELEQEWNMSPLNENYEHFFRSSSGVVRAHGCTQKVKIDNQIFI